MRGGEAGIEAKVQSIRVLCLARDKVELNI